jgi:hypothetical protein
MPELRLGARCVGLVEAVLKLLERQATGFVVSTELVRRLVALGVRDEEVGKLSQRCDRRESRVG